MKDALVDSPAKVRHLPEIHFAMSSGRTGDIRNDCPRCPCESAPPGAVSGEMIAMGKRTTIEADKQASGKEIRVPADQTIKTFTATFDSVRETIDEANKELLESAKDAKGKHLNLSAYKVVKGLFDGFHRAKNESIASEKIAKFLANFDKLREHFGLDKLANLQGRMIAAGTIGGEPPRETDEDGEQDPRPRHLRQPGASAAEKPNPVADLAAKAGAKTQGEDPIDKVGRGPTKLN